MRSLSVLVKALEAFGVTNVTLERSEAVFHDYTKDIETDTVIDNLFGDVVDDRADQGDRRICTSPAHTRVCIGHLYLAFTPEGEYIRAYAPGDGGVLPAHLPE
jgi:hypothetical protein